MSKSVSDPQNPACDNGQKVYVPQQDGVLVLDKPGGMSSAACIARVKRVLGQKKIGHAGTLDPMARGVLLVLLGQATKISGHLLHAGEKIYSGVVKLGITTDTWDIEGQVLEELPVPDDLDDARIRREMAALSGTYEQEVPAYSAAKHEGKALYKLARKGMETPVKKKLVTISRAEAELVGPGRVRFRVSCSSGTYIRSLAHSLGKRLGCGGCLEELFREYSHPFGIASAHSLDDVLANPEGFPQRVNSLADALPEWPKLLLTEEEAAAVRNGARLPYIPERLAGAEFAEGLSALMQGLRGEPVALAQCRLDTGGQQVWGITRGLWNT